MIRYVLLAAFMLVGLSACATLSEGECRSGDWRSIGIEDGAKGRTPSYLGKHAQACAEYGITPDRVAWEAGRQEGLPFYCTPANAWEEGSDGRRLSPVCPDENLLRLQDANRRGLIYNRIVRDMREVQRDIDRINATLNSTEPETSNYAALIAERAFLRLELITLRTESLTYRY